jgi:hypothetical protein
MRGPLDEAVEASPVAGEQIEAAAARRVRPPGGKALQRLVQFLGRRGYTRAARLAMDHAVPEEHIEPVLSLLAAVAPSAAAAPAETAASETAEEATERSALVSLESAQQPTGPPVGFGPQWRSLGPTTIPNGQTYGASRVNVSGRVAAIALDPHNPAHVLCGAAAGGVWESFDRGVTWAPRTDYAPSLAVGAIAYDPTNPSIVYCGTGEGNFYWNLGAGILRSTNGGATWTTWCTNPFVGQGFYDLKVDPGNGQHLLAGAIFGLYVSTNGGTAWTQRRSARTWSISIAPGGSATAEILAACSDGLWRSTDGGTTWTAVTLPGTPGAFDRLAVAHAPTNANTVYVFGARGATAYLWRGSSGAYAAFTPPGGLSTGQAWYDWFLAVAPDRDTQIYVGAIDSWRGDLSGTTWTWTALSNKGATGSSIHPDQHAIAFEPGQPNTVYIGCDGGLYRSADRGITWQHCNNGLVITEFEYIAQNVGSSRWLIGGTQDNGTERWTGSSVWEHVDDGDGGDCAVNRLNPQIVFHEFYNISPVRSTSSGDWASWSGMSIPVPSGEGGLFYCPYTCSNAAGDTVALGTVALYISRNNGANWVRLTFPSAATASALYIPNPDNVYVGTTDGRVFHTSWGGVAWSSLTALTTPRTNAYVSSLYVDSNNLRRLWAVYSTIGGGLAYVSSDGGTTWTNRTAGLPNLPVTAVEVDSRNANRVWVGTDLGVYQSVDLGATWANFSNGLPNVLIGDLLFHPNAWVLRAGTRNRGVWEIPVDGWMTAPACGVQWNGSLAPNQTQRWFTFNWPATWHIVWTIMPTTIDGANAQLTWNVQVQRANGEFLTYWITVQNLTAATVAFEGRFCILSRY